MTLRYDIDSTPIGVVTAVLSDRGLLALHVSDDEDRWVLEMLAREHGAVPELSAGAGESVFTQLHEYFDGDRRAFEVPLDWSLTRGFARDALQAVCGIPYGQTAAYGEIAATAGRPRAARAVGTACRTTPFSLVVPVHRVVRADGSLGEYGGRPETKRFLVELERRTIDSPAGAAPPVPERTRP